MMKRSLAIVSWTPAFGAGRSIAPCAAVRSSGGAC
jgi:hypothetical protein